MKSLFPPTSNYSRLQWQWQCCCLLKKGILNRKRDNSSVTVELFDCIDSYHSHHQLMTCFWLMNFFKHDLRAESKQEKFSRSDKSWEKNFTSAYQFGNHWFYPCSTMMGKTDNASSLSVLMNLVWAMWETSLLHSSVTHKREDIKKASHFQEIKSYSAFQKREMFISKSKGAPSSLSLA